MGRGIISGVIWGSLVSIMAMWVVSQIGDMIDVLRAPPANVVAETPQVAPVEKADAADVPVAPISAAAPSTDPSRQGAALDAGSADAPPVVGSGPATAPEAGVPSEALITPETNGAPSMVASGKDAVLPDNNATALAVPSADSAPMAVAKPAAPKVDTPVEVEQNSPDASRENTVTAPGPEQAPEVVTDPGQPAAPIITAEPVVEFTKPQVVEVPLPVEPAPVPDPEPEAAPEQPVASDTVNEPQSAPEMPVPVADNADANALDAPDVPVKQPATTIGGNVANVRTNQLPTIGGTLNVIEEVVVDAPEVPTDGPAIENFAAEFENLAGQPLMAILLLVDPDSVTDASTAEALPFPVTYVVDASTAGATDAMRGYRRGGFEVVALAPLPAQSNPADVEIAFQSYLNAVPQAVAVMDTPDAVFQSGRQVATQVAEALAASGHGMITYSRGMNSAMQVAERSGVPSAVVFREFDKGGQNTAAIKRFLDQAAFRAGQQTGVILVGHNRPETITALLEWSLGNRASTVALAPVSAVLLAR